MVVNKEWEVDHMDVDCAYLNAPLDQPIYMTIPQGIDIERNEDQVLKLKRLCPMGHLPKTDLREHWLETISKRTPCIYSMGKDREKHLVVYVDDLLIVTPTTRQNWAMFTDIGDIKSVIVDS